ncbi:AT-rich interactive domain-containing protein 1 isoform X2 [Carica papaya]|uniref:AT-rich interactive domain-containing protein 1 isoform X2 n=1 Tax=Carica papaya TaxID=3649 RepID=UPI000B8CACE6|nr:AT-rich interactive domain-containing protein 1 isoform X2 [Carica papaya]
MAGWAIVVDGSSLDCGKTSSELKSNSFWVTLQPPSGLGPEANNLPYCFYLLIRSFLKGVCALGSSRPLPPMLGDGQSVDLLKLFLLVREKGGYDAVSENGLWDLVTEESGLALDAASSVKLVYTKYLDALERWLGETVDEKNSKKLSGDSQSLVRKLMELEAELKEFLPELKKKDDNYPRRESICKLNFSDDRNRSRTESDEEPPLADEDEVRTTAAGFSPEKKSIDALVNLHSCLTTKREPNTLDVEKNEGNNVVEGTACGEKCTGVKDVNNVTEEQVTPRKRKRNTDCEMLKWVTKVAKDPCNPVFASLPEISKWNSYGKDELWKQVLLFREYVFLKRFDDSSAERTAWQNQRMHPCLYDDQIGSSYKLRERLSATRTTLTGKLTSKASFSLGSQIELKKRSGHFLARKENNRSPDSSAKGSVFDYENDKIVPLGPAFQADVPEWTGVPCESDLKWLGTRIWPLVKTNNRVLIERDPIGKGRQDSCGCQHPASIECVRFHIAEKRKKMKVELGLAFYHWKIDKMGEEVARFWTDGEQKKFKTLVELPSLDKCFWERILKFFSSKKKEDLVSYYYNVFLLQSRANQNRSTPTKINSDDESESEEESK